MMCVFVVASIRVLVVIKDLQFGQLKVCGSGPILGGWIKTAARRVNGSMGVTGYNK